MNITFLVANLACGGVERTVSYLSKYFAEHGHCTSIVCISDEQFYDIDEKVNLIKLNVSSECKGTFDRGKKIISRFLKIHKAFKQTKPDCVVCLDAEMLRFIRIQYKLGKFKLITSERTNPLMNTEKQRKAKFDAYRHSDGIVFQTERAKQCFPNDISSKGIVIPNAVGNELVARASTPEKRRKAITAMGRLTTQKDYPTLIKAFGHFYKHHPDFKLEIYGSGNDKDSLCRLTHDMGLDNCIIFEGAVKDAILKVASSSCYVMSSTYEGMPNALMEALAVGTPCVSTDCPFGPAELICNGKNGILIPVGDDKALSDAMCKMIEDTEFAENCAKCAKDILAKQNIENISQKYLDYIIGVVENK